MTRWPLETTPLKDVVLRDFRAAAILDRYQLDSCCGGTQSLSDACRERGISVDEVLAELALVEGEFSSLADELLQHLMKEEKVLSPTTCRSSAPCTMAARVRLTCSAQCRTRFA